MNHYLDARWINHHLTSEISLPPDTAANSLVKLHKWFLFWSISFYKIREEGKSVNCVTTRIFNVRRYITSQSWHQQKVHVECWEKLLHFKDFDKIMTRTAAAVQSAKQGDQERRRWFKQFFVLSCLLQIWMKVAKSQINE